MVSSLRYSTVGAHCALILLVLGMLLPLRLAAQTVQTFNASDTWTAPAGVYTVTVEVWGGGGGGADGGNSGGGGGGGGAYARSQVSVIPGASYTITVGAGGGEGNAGADSYFRLGSTNLVRADGGGAGSGSSGGSGGSTANSIGTTIFDGCSGGNGMSGGTDRGGGGGGSPTSTGNCTAGSAGSSGGLGGTGEGTGGVGSSTANDGTNGGQPGGGGGGSSDQANSDGGAGGAGRILLTYTAKGCSPYRGQVTLNELRIDRSGSSSLTNQIELYNSGGVAQPVWQNWNLFVFSGRSGATPRIHGTYALSSGFTANGQFVFNDNKSIYLLNRNNRWLDVALVDANGDLVDYVAIENGVHLPPGCFGTPAVVNATANGADGDIPRLPDGGNWPANVTNASSHTIGRTNVCSAGSDLSVSNSVDISDPILDTTTITYTVTVSNISCSNTINNIQITDTNISSTNFSSLAFSATQGSTSQSGNNQVWTVGSLAPGTSATLTITGIPRILGSLTTTASVTVPASGLVNTSDDSDAATINVRDFNYVGFDALAATLTEGVHGSFSAGISSTIQAGSSISIAYSVSGTAGAGDRTFTTMSPVTIDPADDESPQSTSIDFGIANDSIIEPQKTIILTLDSVTSSDPAVRLDTSRRTMIITLNDDDVPVLRASYRFDEAAWNGTAGEVIDSSPNAYNATRGGGATIATGSPAYTSGTDSTCNYGRFDMAGSPRAYVQLPAAFPSLNSDFTITAWVRTTNANKTGQRVFVRDDNGNGWALSVSDEVAGTLRLFNRNIQYTGATLTGGGAIRAGNVALDTPVVIVNNVWYFIAVSVDITNRIVTLYVYNAAGTQLAKTSAGFTGSWGVGTGATSIGNETAASGENDLYFNGNIDEVRVYQPSASQANIEAYRTETRTCTFTGFDHLRIEHNGAGVTCSPTILTLKACADATCSSFYTGTVTGTLTATGAPTTNWVGGAAFAIGVTGITTKDVQVTTAGTVTWGASGIAPVASNGTRCFIGATESCSFAAAQAGFLFDVPHHASDTVQTITVRAVKQSDTSVVCTPAFTSTSKTINFGCGYSSPVTGTLPVVVGGSNINCGSTSGVSLAFNASGVATTTVRYADVGQMSLTASYAGSGGSEAGLVMTGSDTFIAAPASLLVTPAGPYVAGNNFSVTVAAKNASGNSTPNFGKESTTENVALGHSLVGPAGGNNPTLAGTTTIPDASFQTGNGSATVSDIKWAEVGDISITASLASASYLGSGLTATGSAAAGPFKPAYFDTAVTPGTGTFTYSGQPFTVQVTAKNAAGGTTLNYQGTYARTVTLSDGNSGTNNSATLGSFSNASLAAASFTNGVASTSTIAYGFASRTTAPLETPTSAPLKLRAVDTDSVTSSGHTEGTTPIRGGRLRLVNFYGSELLRPRVEYRAEYWDGSRWATNTLDATAPIVVGNIATGGLTVNALTALTSGIGFVTFNTAAAGSYDIALDLNAAGVDTSCNAAHAGAPANKPWLQGYWSAPANCGGVAAWAQDPNARIRLGSPRAPYIYLRERY